MKANKKKNQKKKGHNILAIITARGGSKGLPGKNIKKLGGKPLISYTINSAKRSKLITHHVVSTDDKKIAAIAKKHGANIPFMRPKELAKDTTPHLPVLQHAIEHVEKEKGTIFDYIVILQPTSPFRKPEDIDKTILKLINTGADSAVSLVEIAGNHHPIKAKKIENDKVSDYLFVEKSGTRRQDLPTAYKRSGSVYVMRRDLIMKDGKLYGENIVGHIVPSERSIDIDGPLDWVIAEYMLEDLKKKGYQF